jgi:hypothetical protein
MAINVLGVPETKAQVARIPDVFRERMNDATEVTAKEVARGAQARLLASPSIRTRNLYNAVAAAMNPAYRQREGRHLSRHDGHQRH